MINDLIYIRLKAHYDYMYPRMHDKNKAYQFSREILYWIGCFKCDSFDFKSWTKPKILPLFEGEKMALQVVSDVLDSTMERFEEGHSTEYAVEKL